MSRQSQCHLRPVISTLPALAHDVSFCLATERYVIGVCICVCVCVCACMGVCVTV